MYSKEDVIEALNKFKLKQDVPSNLSMISDTISIPKKFKLYDEQLDILVEFINAVEAGNTTFVCNFPTGIGKSLLANSMIALLKYFKYIPMWKQSVIVTHQKLLQNQYEREFTYLTDIRGKSNYFCLVEMGSSIDTAPCSRDKEYKCRAVSQCPYYSRRNFIFEKEAKSILTNYAWYFTYSSSLWNYEGALGCQVFDEAHLMEDILIDRYKIDIEEVISNIEAINKVYNFDPQHNFKLLLQVKNVNEISVYLAFLVENFKPYKEYLHLKKALGNYLKIEEIYNTIQYVLSSKYLEYKLCNRKLYVTPLHELITSMNNKSKYSIYLSSTVANEYVHKNMVRNCYFMERPSLFEIDRRKIYNFQNLFRLNSEFFEDGKKIGNWITVIDWIINQYPDEKGVIFTSSFEMASYMKHSKYKDRLLIHDNSLGSKTLSQLFEIFKSSKDKILVSPSISTGFDFKGDLSRFQIIAKIPFTDFNSEERQVYGEDYYYNSTMNKIIQMTGRSIRDKNDYATTYILDSSLKRLIERSYPPKWWTDSVEYV